MKVVYIQPQLRIERLALLKNFCQSGLQTGSSIEDLTEEEELKFD